MAEAFGHMAGESELRFYSSGSKPSGAVNERAIEFMAELDYDLSQHHSKSLSEIPQIEYDRVITMGCGDECPLVLAKVKLDWGIDDPKELDAERFRDVRSVIKNKVDRLIAHLAQEG